MKYKNIIKLRLPEVQLLAVVPTQLKFSIVKDHDEPTVLLFETLFCMWECFNMGTELYRRFSGACCLHHQGDRIQVLKLETMTKKTKLVDKITSNVTSVTMKLTLFVF
jgi:hypothetical protein